MATKATAGRKPAPVPAPVKVTKTRLTKDMRSTLHHFMVQELSGVRGASTDEWSETKQN
jgi:hypothetical protein